MDKDIKAINEHKIKSILKSIFVFNDSNTYNFDTLRDFFVYDVVNLN